MKKNNLIKTLASVSATVLIGIGLNGSTHLVQAADTTNSSSVITTNNSTNTQNASQTGNISIPIPTVDATVKNDNPTLYLFPLETTAGTTAKTEKSTYKAGETVKVRYYIDLTDQNSSQSVKGYYVGTKEVDGKKYVELILGDDITTSATVPTYDEFSKIIQEKVAAAKKEYEEKAKADAEKQQADLKKRFLYYTAKRKNTKKTSYYYTAYRKTKNKKTTFIFKKNKYKFKAKKIKIDYSSKSGKTTYYHVKGKSANFWVKSTDVKDLKPVFRKK